MIKDLASDRISDMSGEFGIEEMVEFRARFKAAVAEIADTEDPRLQRTLRRFRAAVVAEGPARHIGMAVMDAVSHDFTRVIDTKALAGTEFVDKGGHLKRDGQPEADLNTIFLSGLRSSGLFAYTNESIVTFARATLAETEISLNGITTARLVDRIGVALTKYADQRYFPQPDR